MGRSTVHYADNTTNNILKRLHNKLRPAGTPVQRVEYIIELLLLRIFEIKLRHDNNFRPLRDIFSGDNEKYLFSYLQRLTGEQIKLHLNKEVFPFYAQILSRARQVFKNNLPQKVQDNLVLIEEVFANSSFTTNVQSGNMSEIIGLISEIDETTILKTDILGDAIESALSETGGTQDIGLYRTPEHIRQMMVALTDPTFEDTIFDPACGTGGFLFDAYHYCIEKATKDGKWPSPKCPPSHPELNEYFKQYFLKFKDEMPDIDTANRFYREGVGGIEYLGMIRKMAAVNLYIRGLNPANIFQGDSLQHYKPETDANSKTLILSNPPFGAERDQPAYPNVWQEYAKETETTILFVKLMFDLLKKGGRCAVVVSEGFLTWDRASARAMRKILLEEANLKAIISLPQGVFVSKQGQGAKTSILYFEKGSPTKWVWYYKIENDGFTMGVNRKPIDGCQIPEIIETFHNYVKLGKIPPETKNSFIIPVEWIKTLDPRMKERIRIATEEKIIIKKQAEREKLENQLKERKEKGRITEDDYKEKLKSFDLITQIQNETSKEIEKAYLYSFNFQTYKSDLTDEQIKEWKEILSDIEPENNLNIDEKYEKLKTADVKTALKILASFNPKYALEMDIARDVLNKLPPEDEKIKKLQEILKKGHRYPRICLGELIFDISGERIFYINDDKIYREPSISTKNNTISVKNESYGRDLKVKKRILIKQGDLVISLLHTQNGAFAFSDGEYASTGTFIPFEINTSLIDRKYLFFMLRKTLSQMQSFDATGRENYKVEQILQLQIPLPPLEVQKEIVEIIETNKKIVESVEALIKNSEKNRNYFLKYIIHSGEINWYDLEEVCVDIFAGGDVPNDYSKTKNEEYRIPIYTNGIGDKSLYGFTKKARVSQECVTISARGTIGYSEIREEPFYPAIRLIVVIPNINKINTRFLKYILNIVEINKTGNTIQQLTVPMVKRIKIPLPPLETQQKIVEELDKEMEALEKVKLLKEKAEKRIEEIINEVWGEE